MYFCSSTIFFLLLSLDIDRSVLLSEGKGVSTISPLQECLNEMDLGDKKVWDLNPNQLAILVGSLSGKISEKLAIKDQIHRKEIDSLKTENIYLKTKSGLRNEIDKIFNKLAPTWLVMLPLSRKWQWFLLFQLETEETEKLKSRVLGRGLHLFQFCENMEESFKMLSRDIHSEDLPYYKSEKELNNILLKLDFAEKAQRESIIVLIVELRQFVGVGSYKGVEKYIFLHFPSLKTTIKADDIVELVQPYIKGYSLHSDNVTIPMDRPIENARKKPSSVHAFVRFPGGMKMGEELMDLYNLLANMIKEFKLQTINKPTEDEKIQLERLTTKLPVSKIKEVAPQNQRLTVPELLYSRYGF